MKIDYEAFACGKEFDKMNQDRTLKMIEELSNANGVSGFEDDVLKVLRKYGNGLGDFSEDSLRNLYIDYKGNTGSRPIVLLDAHTDEVGFMVRAVKPNGTLLFTNIGGWVANTIPAHRVRIQNRDGEYITGIVATKPPHFMSEEERKEPVSIQDMVIDIGASSVDEVMNEYKIGIGAPIVPDAVFEYNEERDLMLGKAFDCRLGCASIIKVLEELNGQELNVDLKAGFSVQEEVGIRGAVVTSNRVKPDIAIVFEGSPGDDTFAEPYMVQTAMKKGPMLRHLDARMITNPRLLRFTLDLAEKCNISVQEAVRTGGSTNGGSLHLANEGIPVVVIGLPVRYIHTHYGFASYYDFDCGVKLGTELIKALDGEIIRGF